MGKALVFNDVSFSSNKVTTITFEGAHTTSISVSPSSISFTSIGETILLSCILTPSNSVDPVVWTTSNANIATVSNGLVMANGVGSCTITVTSGSCSATCSVIVSVDTYLTGTVHPNTLVDPNSSGNNTFTKTTCNVGATGTSTLSYISMVASVQNYTNEMLCGNMAKNVATSPSYNFEIIAPEDMEEGTNQKFTYDEIGYPMPMQIPTGTAKLKCIGLSASYGARAIFFDSTRRALDTSENVNGAAYYCAYRKKQTPTAEDYTWVYQNNLEFEVPEGYDSVVVVWKTDPSDQSAVMPSDMTTEQLAQFKVQCLSS